MTTYQPQLRKALSERVIPAFWLGYFREAYREQINSQLIELCAAAAAARGGVSRKDIAEKIGRRPEQVTRWLASPGNLESDTVSDLALAFGCRPIVRLEKIHCDETSQQRHPLLSQLEIEAAPGYFKKPVPASMASLATESV